MTEKEMNKLADIIVAKMIDRQIDYDNEFKSEMQEMIAETDIVFDEVGYDSVISDNLIFLEDMLLELLKEEDYEKAAEIKAKILGIKKKYDL